MTEKYLAVKLTLDNGQALAITLFEQEARNLLANWMKGKLPAVIGDETCLGPWAIQSSKIVSVQLFPVDEKGAIAQPQQRSPFAPPGRGSSGLACS